MTKIYVYRENLGRNGGPDAGPNFDWFVKVRATDGHKFLGIASEYISGGETTVDSCVARLKARIINQYGPV